MKNYTFTLGHGKKATIALFFRNNGYYVNVDLLLSQTYHNIDQRILNRLAYRHLDQTPIEVPLNNTGADLNYDIRCCFKNYRFFRDPAALPWIDTFTCARMPSQQSNYIDMIFTAEGKISLEAKTTEPIEVHIQVVLT